MHHYTCSKCGETMISKNPANRNVFPTDQMASMMTNITNVITTRKENGRRMVTIEFPYTDGPSMENEPDDVLEMECLKIIRHLSDETLAHWICDHKWEQAKVEAEVEDE